MAFSKKKMHCPTIEQKLNRTNILRWDKQKVKWDEWLKVVIPEAYGGSSVRLMVVIPEAHGGSGM